MTSIVLIVEDDPGSADAYAEWLKPDYTVRVTASVTEAMAALDPEIDIALIDRRLPDGTGTDILTAITDQNLACRTAMLTAVDPDFDIIDLPIQEYLVKPVTRDELRGIVKLLDKLASYDAIVNEIYALASKQAALNAVKPPEELNASTEYTTLERRLTNAMQRADTTFDQLSTTRSFSDLYVDINADHS